MRKELIMINKHVLCLIIVLSIYDNRILSHDFNETAVLILARGGSKGVRLKNVQKVGNVTLLYRSIRCAKSAGLRDITVSTDHPLIALEALLHGVNIYHRSRLSAEDWAPSIWGAAEFLDQRPNVNILVLIQLTSPFLKTESLISALKKISVPVSRDCVFSVTKSYKLRWNADASNNIHPVNFDLYSRPRRQDMKVEYLEAGAFYITRRNLIEQGVFQNFNCTFQVLDTKESLEIDSYYDLRVANALHTSNLV